MAGEYQDTPEELFPDSAYTKRLGHKTYDEALLYEGEAQELRIEFKLPHYVPVSWWAVRKAIEAQLRIKGRRLLRLELRQGPEIGGFTKTPATAYKVQVTEHGSPVFPLVVLAIIKGLALLFAASAVWFMAVRANPVTFERLAESAVEIPKALKIMALAGLGTAILGALKGFRAT